jgi:6-phosphofructokinase 2
MPGATLSENEWQKILQVIETTENVKFIVASGSLPPGVPVDIFARMAIIARKKNAKLIIDSSGEALKYATDEGVYLIKPNLGELSALVGKDYLEPGEISGAARQLIEKGNCEVVVVSMGSAGAMLVTRELERTIVPPRINRKSTVGAGDSMVAGIVLYLSKGKSLENAVRYGVACGTAATMNPGTELCKPDDAEILYSLLYTDSINREYNKSISKETE